MLLYANNALHATKCSSSIENLEYRYNKNSKAGGDLQ